MGRFFRVADSNEHISGLLKKKFVRIQTKKDGSFVYRGLSGKLDAYSLEQKENLEKYSIDLNKDPQCYAKLHSGVLVEMHHVDVFFKNSVSVWYKLNVKALNELTKLLVSKKREVRFVKKRWDQAHDKLYLKAQNGDVKAKRRYLLEDDPTCRKWKRKMRQLLDHIGKRIIDKKIWSFIDAISVRPYHGNFFFTFDVPADKTEAKSYANFINAFRSLWPGGPGNRAGGAFSKGRPRLSKELKDQKKKRRKNLIRVLKRIRQLQNNAEKEDLDRAHHELNIQQEISVISMEIAVKEEILYEFMQSDLTPAKWADEVMRRKRL